MASFDATMVPLVEMLDSAASWAVWGATDNGDQCLWLAPTGDEPERVVVVDGDETEWATYPTSVTGFLYGLFTGAFTCPVFPDDYPFTTDEAVRGVSRILGRELSTTNHFFITPQERHTVGERWDEIGPSFKAI